MPKIKFSERFKELVKKLHLTPIATATEPEECEPIVLVPIKPPPDVEPPKPVPKPPKEVK